MYRIVLLLALTTTHAHCADGLIELESRNSLTDTVQRLEVALKNKGMTLFTRIDHRNNASKAGLELPPTQVVIFGNPKVGTPLMQCAPTAAIDLPQKMLIREDADGKVWLAYNDPIYLAKRHGVRGCDALIKKIQGALNHFATSAAGSN